MLVLRKVMLHDVKTSVDGLEQVLGESIVDFVLLTMDDSFNIVM